MTGQASTNKKTIRPSVCFCINERLAKQRQMLGTVNTTQQKYLQRAHYTTNIFIHVTQEIVYNCYGGNILNILKKKNLGIANG